MKFNYIHKKLDEKVYIAFGRVKSDEPEKAAIGGKSQNDAAVMETNHRKSVTEISDGNQV